MSRWAGVGTVLLILLALAIAIVGPVLASGYGDVGRAEAALHNSDTVGAAKYYELAAVKLPWRTDLWEQAALSQIRSGNLDAAASIYASLRQRGVLSAGGWEIYGGLSCANGHTQECLNIWLAGLDAYPSHTHFYALISAAYQDMHAFPEQRSWLEKWIATGQATAPDHFVLGALLLTSDPVRSRRELDRAASMDTNWDSAAKTLEASLDIAAQEPEPAQQLVILGRGLGLVNQWPLAEAAFQQAVAVDAQNAEAWAWLGEAHQEVGKSEDDGKPELDKALALDPKDAVVRGLRGLYWKRHGEYAAQLEEYQAAAQIEPDNPQWQAALGEAYTLRGDLVAALGAYQKATSLAPGDAAYWRLLALFCADNGVQVYELGLPAARKAAELAPKDAQVQDALGWAYAQAGLLYNAQETLLKAVNMAPNSAAIHLHLAETYLRKGDQRSAYQELKLVVDLDGKGPSGQMASQLLQQLPP